MSYSEGSCDKEVVFKRIMTTSLSRLYDGSSSLWHFVSESRHISGAISQSLIIKIVAIVWLG